MTTFFESYTLSHNSFESFMTKIKTTKSKNKLTNVKINSYNYKLLLTFNFTRDQLKNIASDNNLNINGNKNVLLTRIYIYFYLNSKSIIIQRYFRKYFTRNLLNSKSIIIQRYFRGHLTRNYIQLHGPGFKDKSVCNNNFDILSMDELTNVSYNQFFSYKDEDNFIYGFDIITFYNLIKNEKPTNPFNKKIITNKTINQFCVFLRLSKLLNIEYNILNNSQNNLSPEKQTELRIVSLFQKMDELGNYTKHQWFLSLDKQNLTSFLLNLIKIWCLIPNKTTLDICPSGNPFFHFNNPNYIKNCDSITSLRHIILNSLDLLVGKGSSENKNLGALYILSALTLVNKDAATSLPWLYESVRHIQEG
jgi:hypothetical protein